jgi:hypothetical protein
VWGGNLMVFVMASTNLLGLCGLMMGYDMCWRRGTGHEWTWHNFVQSGINLVLWEMVGRHHDYEHGQVRKRYHL